MYESKLAPSSWRLQTSRLNEGNFEQCSVCTQDKRASDGVEGEWG